ncbi:MAG: M23 family metallopeptidase [Saprospiraceae bacterium]|nr:M23 family metallopeptidase [Saprospiraceae bacterium]
MRPWIFPLLGLLFLNNTDGDDYPKDFFRAPISHPIRLSGSFGELRSNHFHSGIDIKSSKGAEGDPILSAGDGYVARIKVDGAGYGNSLYVAHPNGYTTVYAHLQRFNPEITAFVKSEQYARESFAIDVTLKPDQFVVNRGTEIGKMGNTGSSGGPHLHFEIRDTKTDDPINPLLFGLKVLDTQAPRMHQIKLYDLNENRSAIRSQAYNLSAAGGTYRIKGDTLYSGSLRAGVALKTYDHTNGASNWNGVYAISMFCNDSLVYRFKAERFSFSQTRYLNAHLDYEERVLRTAYLNRCYLLPGNQLNLYDYLQDYGTIALSPNRASKITLVAEDIFGNKSRSQFWLKYRIALNPPQKPHNYLLLHDDENAIDNGEVYLHFPNGSFYEDLYFNYRMTDDASDNVFSKVHHLHSHLTPVHHFFDIAIRPKNLPESLKDKAFVAYCSTNGSITNVGSEWKYDRLWGEARVLGDYYIMVDTVAPTIRPVAFQRDMRGKSSMTFSIRDNFSTTGAAQPLSFRGTIDGQWVLFEYDQKTSKLFYRFDERVTSGEHFVRLELTDAMGNQSVFERSFLK